MRHVSSPPDALQSRLSGEADEFLAPQSMKSWRGASGQNWTYVVFTLIGCPAFESANFILIKRTAEGRRKVLRIGRTETSSASLNLARIRRDGATLGANEVHVYAQAESDQQRAAIDFDLAAVDECVDGASQTQH